MQIASRTVTETSSKKLGSQELADVSRSREKWMPM